MNGCERNHRPDAGDNGERRMDGVMCAGVDKRKDSVMLQHTVKQQKANVDRRVCEHAKFLGDRMRLRLQ